MIARVVRRAAPLLAMCGAVAVPSRALSAQRSVPQPGIDVRHYDVALDLPDTGAFLRADVTVHVRRSEAAARLRLDLVDGMSVRRVQVDGADVAAARGAGTVDVPLDATRDSARVRVVYDGVVTDGLIVRRDARGRWTWFGDNWPARARHWLASVDHPSDKASVSFTVRAPAARTVVANGELLGTRRLADGRSETRWRESRPIATYLMVIAAAPLARHDLREPDCHYGDEGQCVRQTIYVAPEHRAWLPGPFVAVGPIVSLFEGLVAPFPYEKLAHLESSTRFGGMENASAIFYDERLFAKPTIGDALMAHETAHQWFGDAVTEREWGHLWLSEGFATYFAALWTQFVRGDVAYRAEMARIREQVLADPVVAARPVIDTAQTDLMSLLNTNSYQKGAYVLYMLHRELGDSAFFAGIRSYYAAHRHGNATTDDLRTALEQGSGRDLRTTFDQWLRRPGWAEPSVGWAHDAATGTVTMLVLQDGTRGTWELPVPVVVTAADGTVTRLTVRVPAEGRASVALPGQWPAKPRSVRADPDSLLLARVRPL